MLRDKIAEWLLTTGFVTLRWAPKGKLARARVKAYGMPVESGLCTYLCPCHLFGTIAVVEVPLALWWPPLGMKLAGWAINVTSR